MEGTKVVRAAGPAVLLVLCSLLFVGPVHAGKLKLLASFIPIKALTEDVVAGARGVELEMLVPGTLGCPHDFALSFGDFKRLEDADLLIVNGLGLESFLPKIRKAFPKLRVLEATRGPASAGENKSSKPKSEASTGRRGVANPHIWTSPRRAVAMVRVIAEELSLIDPERAALYRRNARNFADTMEDIAAGFERIARKSKNPRIVTIHDVFDALAEDTGVEVAGLVHADSGTPLSAGRLSALIRSLRARPAAAIFIEAQYSDRIARVLSRETGIPIYTLDPLATGIGEAGEYERVMRRNLATWEKAL